MIPSQVRAGAMRPADTTGAAGAGPPSAERFKEVKGMKKRIVGTLMALLLAATVLPLGAISVTSADVTSGLVTTAYAEDEHQNHCICGATHRAVGDHEDEDKYTGPWTGISSLDAITGDGYYYLKEDVQLYSSWEMGYKVNNVVICLNGHSITQSGTGVVIDVSGGTLTLTDCAAEEEQGTITHVEDLITHTVHCDHGVRVTYGTFNMYGGRITGNTSGYVDSSNDPVAGKGGGVYVGESNFNSDAVFNMYGGTITGNKADQGGKGGGVYVLSGRTFNMYGGTIGGTTAADANTASAGGGVYVAQNAKFTMTDGTITGNTAAGNGGGVYVERSGEKIDPAVFTMTRGQITNNTVTGTSDGCDGGGVYLQSSLDYTSTLKISGDPVISGNKKGADDDNLYFSMGNGKGQIIVTGPLTGSAEIKLNGPKKDAKIVVGDISCSNSSWYTQTGNTLTAGTGGGETGGETTEHKHCVCGSGTLDAAGHTHDASVTWTAINNEEELKKLNSEAGYYYLNASFETGFELVPCKGTYLCLNGKTLTLTRTGDYGIKISLGSEFTLTDCKSAAQQGTIIADRAQKFAVEVYTGGSTSTSVFNMYGGTISGNGSAKTPGVEVERSIFNMYGGTITEFTRGVSMLDGTFNMYGESAITNNNTHYNRYNWYTSDGSAVFVNGNFNMYGGSITGNHNSTEGCVYVANGSKFSMYGGTISENSAEYGGGVRVCGTLEMGPGALIENNGVKDDTVVAKKGGGVYNTGKLIMKGGTITGNKASKSGSGVFSSGKFSIGDESSPNGITVKVTDNKKGNAENNVWLEGAETKITVKGSLNSDSEIGITRIDAHEWQYIDGDTSGTAGYFKVDGEANASFNGRGEISSHGEHKHEFNDKWTMDGTYHWHECIVAGCPMGDGSVQERAVHVYDNDTDTTCNTCGYVRTISGGEEKPETQPRYYYNSTTTTDTKADETKNGPKTADAGALVYLGLALSSYTGTALVMRRKKEF